MRENPRLFELVRRVSRARALSRKTENAYLNHIRRFQNFHAERDLSKVGANGINAFLNHLNRTENLAVSTRNQALSALVFLYRDVFGQADFVCPKNVGRVKPKTKTPAVFTREEANEVLSKLRGEPFLAAALMYGAGLRLSETVALRVGDIDFENRKIAVRDTRTGRRDRTTILPRKIIPALKKHLAAVYCLFEDDSEMGFAGVRLPERIARDYPQAAFDWRWQFVFPTHNLNANTHAPRVHLAESTVQKAVTDAIIKADVVKTACCQTFRYSFAARLFERNCDIRRIQNLLGHKNLKSTAFYLQFARACAANVRSPLDN